MTIQEKIQKGTDIFCDLQKLSQEIMGGYDGYLNAHFERTVMIENYSIKFEASGNFARDNDVIQPDISYRFLIQDPESEHTRLGSAFIPTSHGLETYLSTDENGAVFFKGYVDSISFIAEHLEEFKNKCLGLCVEEDMDKEDVEEEVEILL